MYDTSLWECTRHYVQYVFTTERSHVNYVKNLSSLIFPHFDYACFVFRDLSITLTESLTSLLKACVRFVAGNIPFRARVTQHRIAVSQTQERILHCYASIQVSRLIKSQLYVHSRFAWMSEDITLKRSERHSAQLLYSNFLRPEKADRSFKKAATDLLNGFNLSAFDMSDLDGFKREIHQVLLGKLELSEKVLSYTLD